MTSHALRPGTLARELLSSSRRSTSVPRGDIAHLDAGDPDFETPAHIRRALADAVESGATHYSGPFGDPRLRALLAERLSRRGAARFDESQVIVTHGGSGGLGAAFLACLDRGDRVVIPDPTYSLYADQVRLAGGVPVFVRLDMDFRLDIEALDAACRGARMLVVCNPCNPTGVVFRADEMEAIGRIACEHDLLVLVDEAYDAIVFEGTRFVSGLEVDALAERLLYCNTFSKTYAMTGWRIGYVAAPSELAHAVGKMHVTLHGPMNTAVQRAAIAALTGPQDCVDTMVREYARRREILLEHMHGVPGVEVCEPQGTFYAFLRYPQHVDSVTMRQRALDAGVSVRPGSEFGDGGEGHLRLAFTADEATLETGLARLHSLLTS